jgi:hypothetical protein
MVVGATLVLALISLVFSLLQEPVYTAEATVAIVPLESDSGEDLEGFSVEVLGVVATEDFARGVMQRAGWQAGPGEFDKRLDVKPVVTPDGEARLRVLFSGSDPEEAARSANAYATLFAQRVRELNDQRLAGASLAADARVLQEASPPEEPSRPRPLLYAAVAAVLGLVLGSAGALLLEGGTRRWRGARDAELTLRAPVLGMIPEYSSAEEKR